MSGRKPTQSQLEPRLAGIPIQNSLYGLTLGVYYGRVRVPGNLLWYGGFRSEQQTETSEGGKGGARAPGRSFYVYYASVLMALGDAPVAQVRTVWKGKQKFSGQATGTTTTIAEHQATIPASPPYTVAVPATWAAHIEAAFTSPDWYLMDDPWISLNSGFTVAGGTYTFDAELAGKTVRLRYQRSSVTAAVDALGQLGLTLATGALAQSVWSYLSASHPTEALGYSGIAYVRGQDYPLTSGAAVDNHTFEIDTLYQQGAEGDANPADVVLDVLTNTRYGVAGFSSGLIGSLEAYRAYCTALGLLVSPVYLEQRAAREVLAELLDATNTDAAWNGATLRFLPRGDETVGGFTPDTTIAHALSIDDFVVPEGSMPVVVERASAADAHNLVRAEFTSRANDYSRQPVEAKDETSIRLFGLRAESSLTWHFFCLPSAAQQAVRIRLQRKQAARNRYRFSLPWRFADLEVGDLVTLTEAHHGLAAVVAKVQSIEEADDETFDIEAEDFPLGHASAPVVTPQTGSGFIPNFNADPGSVVAPRFIEPPGSMTETGLEVWAAVTGPSGNPYWGGCDVHVSLDGGSSYKRVARVVQGARYGALTAGLSAGAATLSVALVGRGGELHTVTAAERNALATLAFVGDTATGEWLAFQTATLTGANAYDLTSLLRGRYGSTDQAASNGAGFVYVDEALGKSGPLARELIGSTIKFKFCSFNVFETRVQSLAEVAEYSYTISGRFADKAVSGGNLLPNVEFRNSPADWVAGNTIFSQYEIALGTDYLVLANDTLTTTTTFIWAVDGGAWGIPNYRVKPRNALMIHDYEGATHVRSRYIQTKRAIPVKPGQRIEAQAWVASLNATGELYFHFYNAAGAFLSSAPAEGGVLACTSAEGFTGQNELANFKRLWGFATVPSGAAGVRPAICKSRTTGGAGVNSWVLVAMPFKGFAHMTQTEPSLWGVGVAGGAIDGRDAVDTGQIADEAATEVLDAYASGASLSSASVSVTPCSLVVTPKADCRVVVTATVEGSITYSGNASYSPFKLWAKLVTTSSKHAADVRTIAQGTSSLSPVAGSAALTAEFDMTFGESVTTELQLLRDNWTGSDYAAASYTGARLRVEIIYK